MNLLLLLSALCLAAEGDGYLLALSGKAFVVERIGRLTAVRCAEGGDADDCGWLESVDPRPTLDWEGLLKKAKGSKKRPAASETVVDQYGGPWVVEVWSVTPSSYTIRPDFPGYKYQKEDGKPALVEVLRQRADWEEAATDLKLDPATGKRRKKKGLRAFLD